MNCLYLTELFTLTLAKSKSYSILGRGCRGPVFLPSLAKFPALSLLLTILFFVLSCSFLSAQNKVNSVPVQDVFHIRIDNAYTLSATSVLPGTEILRLRGRFLSHRDYRIQYERGTLQLSDSVIYSIFDTLIVMYQALPTALPKTFYRHKPEYQFSEKTKDSVLMVKPLSQSLSSESIFGNNLEKSGTLIRGFTVGTNRDLTVQSGFRLQLSGKLSDDIDLTASLTDENSPIQPEGNTERLDELDKIFIQVRHPNVTATFGDFDLQKKLGEFGIINRKLQGLSGEVQYSGHGAFAAFAVARGKFTTASLQGADAVQGPYQLTGRNNERDIIVIAGSERVYLNGEAVKRGEQNDYTIDYANAQVTFTQNRIITAASRIFVEFEYTDRQYTRNVFAAGANTHLLDNKVQIGFLYLRDADNQDSPIDISLTNEEKNTLKQAGDNRLLAVKSGVSLAAIDSVSGARRGLYQKIDSASSGSTITYYKYAPNQTGAWYNVTFSYLGSGLGAYSKDAPGVFRYVGKGLGAYDTTLALPFAEMKQFSSLLLSYQVLPELRLKLEGAVSSYDKNRFSSIDDNDNNGFAGSLLAELAPVNLRLFSVSLGKLGGSYKERSLQKRFSPAERISDVEFNRNYNVTDASSGQDEQLREIALHYTPLPLLTNSFSYGLLRRGSASRSDRFNNAITVKDANNYQGTYLLDYTKNTTGVYKSTWYKHTGNLQYNFNNVSPLFTFSAEDKRDVVQSKDSLLGSSLAFVEVKPGLETKPIQGLSLSGEYVLRNDKSAIGGRMVSEAVSRGFSLNGDYRTGSVFSSTLTLSSLQKKYSSTFARKGMLNSEVVLVKSQSRFTPLRQFSSDILYAVSTQKTAKLDRVFVQVTKGFGNYRYVGDLNKNGIQDEQEYEPALYDGDYSLITVPSDVLYPVIDLKTGVRLRYNFSGIFARNSLPEMVIAPLSFESYSRIEENSTEPDLQKIYLLQLGSFRKINTTIRGSNLFEQSVYLFENAQDFNTKLFYSFYKGLNQYGSGAEYSLRKEQSVRIKIRLLEDIANQTELKHTEDALTATTNSVRNRLINTDAVILDFSYRPYPNVEAGFKIRTAKSTDKYPTKPTELNLNGQSVRINISFTNAGRLRIEFERNELGVNVMDNYLPYELTEGNGIGKNYFIRANFDYRIADNLQSSANYDGRSISGSKIIHTMRAELRAFF